MNQPPPTDTCGTCDVCGACDAGGTGATASSSTFVGASGTNVVPEAPDEAEEAPMAQFLSQLRAPAIAPSISSGPAFVKATADNWSNGRSNGRSKAGKSRFNNKMPLLPGPQPLDDGWTQSSGQTQKKLASSN